MNKITVSFLMLLLFSNIAGAVPYQSGEFDPVRDDVDSWTCYDTAINFARENPEWGVITMSNNPNFYGISHVANYQIQSGVLYIHDETKSLTMGFQDERQARNMNDEFAHCYYKICDPSETPKRNYRRLKDNLNDYYN